MIYAGDTIGDATRSYQADQAERQNAFANSINQFIGVMQQKKAMAARADEFNRSMAFSKSQALQSQIQQGIQNKFTQQQLDIERANLASGVSPAQARKDRETDAKHNENLGIAQQNAAQGSYGSIDDVKKDLPDASDQEANFLLNASMTYRKYAEDHNTQVGAIADKVNQVSALQARQKALMTATRQPQTFNQPSSTDFIGTPVATMTGNNAAPNTSWQTDPNSALVSRQAAFAQSLQQAHDQLLPYVDPKAGYVTPDPITGKVKPVLINTPWLATRNTGVATAMLPKNADGSFLTGQQQNQENAVDSDFNNSFNDWDYIQKELNARGKEAFGVVGAAAGVDAQNIANQKSTVPTQPQTPIPYQKGMKPVVGKIYLIQNTPYAWNGTNMIPQSVSNN